MIKGEVKKVSDFLATSEWLFVIEYKQGTYYFIMPESFYKNYNLKTPITKRELDSLDIGMSISFLFEKLESKFVITQIFW